MKKILILFISIILFLPVFAQEQTDSLKTKRLDEVIIKGKALFDMERLTPVEGTNIWSGIKILYVDHFILLARPNISAFNRSKSFHIKQSFSLDNNFV